MLRGRIDLIGNWYANMAIQAAVILCALSMVLYVIFFFQREVVIEFIASWTFLQIISS